VKSELFEPGAWLRLSDGQNIEYTAKVVERFENTSDDLTLYRLVSEDFPDGELFSHAWLRTVAWALPRRHWRSYETRLLVALL